MSRIGKMPVPVPPNVKVELADQEIRVAGPLGQLQRRLPPSMKVTITDGELRVERPSDSKLHRSLHGLTRSLIANMVEGVVKGFVRRLEINGVGYRAQQGPNGIVLQVGYSHPVDFPAPPGVTLTVEGGNRIVVSGPDKELVGETAARIRRIRPPEPYKGKGIKYAEEVVRKKAGKAGGKKK